MALGLVVLLITGLVFALSFKMRHREFATLEDIGVSHGTLAMVKVFEVLMIGVLASFIVIITSLIVQHFGASLVRLALS
jgi:putative ABC transport system permease protein